MIWIVYIIQSTTTQRYYIGCTSDLDRRLKEHNTNKGKSTRYRGPYAVVYIEEHSSRQLALARERQIKSYKGGNAFKSLLSR